MIVIEYTDRLQHGLKPGEKKLLPLFEIGQIMTKTIANVLFDNGIDNIKKLAEKNPFELQKILTEAKPFQRKQVYI